MSGFVITLLGAESTGKTTLAAQLADALLAQGVDAVCVSEYLREFCDARGRTPTPQEQHHIAAEQARRIEAAAAGHVVVVADTAPLMTAVYSDYVFGDQALYDGALDWQRRHAGLTLLTGLDLPWQPDGLQRDGPQVREPIDGLLRAALVGIGHSTVYGLGPSRLKAALAAAAPRLGLAVDAADARSSADDAPFSRWRARCAECLQPDCEHLAALLPRVPTTT